MHSHRHDGELRVELGCCMQDTQLFCAQINRKCRSPRQGVLIFNNDYHFRVHQISHCGPAHSINRTEASHQVDPRPGREVAMVTRAIPARRLPLLLELCLFQNANPVATSGPDLPLLCSALPARLPAVPLFLWSSCLPACLALCWQLAVAGRGAWRSWRDSPRGLA